MIKKNIIFNFCLCKCIIDGMEDNKILVVFGKFKDERDLLLNCRNCYETDFCYVINLIKYCSYSQFVILDFAKFCCTGSFVGEQVFLSGDDKLNVNCCDFRNYLGWNE